MKRLSPQTKSFAILFSIALVGCYLAVMLSRDVFINPDMRKGYQSIAYPYSQVARPAVAAERTIPPVKTVDTSKWKTYSDSKFPLSFKYNPAWKIKPGKTNSEGTYVLAIDPGPKYYDLVIYVSNKSFEGLDGLPTMSETIDGELALNVSNLLYGIKNGDNFYTFDSGLSASSLINDFNALVHSVNFN